MLVLDMYSLYTNQTIATIWHLKKTKLQRDWLNHQMSNPLNLPSCQRKIICGETNAPISVRTDQAGSARTPRSQPLPTVFNCCVCLGNHVLNSFFKFTVFCKAYIEFHRGLKQ